LTEPEEEKADEDVKAGWPAALPLDKTGWPGNWPLKLGA